MHIYSIYRCVHVCAGAPYTLVYISLVSLGQALGWGGATKGVGQRENDERDSIQPTQFTAHAHFVTA